MANTFLQEFAEYLKAQNRSGCTVESYVQAVKDFSGYFSGAAGEEFRPGSILSLDVMAYRDYLIAVEKKSPKTVNARLAGLKAYCGFLVQKGVLAENPVLGVENVKVEQKVKVTPRTLSRTELYRLRRRVHAAGNPRDIAVFEVLANTGIRVSELCALEVDDLEISDRKGTLTVKMGKGGKFRQVPLNKAARDAVQYYLKVRPEGKRLFLGERGPMTPSGVYRLLKKYAEQAGLRVSPHVLRHTFARSLLVNGEDIVKVAHFLGHEDLRTTAVYTQPTEEDLQNTVERLT